MKFYLESELVSFEQFQGKFPEESKILAQYTDKKVEVLGTGKNLKYRLDGKLEIGIEALKSLEYHQKTFYKRSPYQENLARALGIKNDKDKDLKILDATAGLMSDSLMMVALGLRNLTIMERHPLIQALILNTIKNCPDLRQINFQAKDSAEIDENFDIIYFDPMYHETNQKAASKKQMVFMRQIVGADQDAKEQAKNLLHHCKRLVIKRSQKASPLLEGSGHQVQGKSTHYDIYFNNEMKFGISG